MKLSLVSALILLILSGASQAFFLEFENENDEIAKGRQEDGWNRKFDFVPDSSIPKGKSNRLANINKNRQPTRKTTSSSKTGMWGR